MFTCVYVHIYIYVCVCVCVCTWAHIEYDFSYFKSKSKKILFGFFILKKDLCTHQYKTLDHKPLLISMLLLSGVENYQEDT